MALFMSLSLSTLVLVVFHSVSIIITCCNDRNYNVIKLRFHYGYTLAQLAPLQQP